MNIFGGNGVGNILPTTLCQIRELLLGEGGVDARQVTWDLVSSSFI